ncbi:class I SAM-dependent methyltransferase [bacterium]|nr:MAG: class I SAM-dependent methyltransferase [bacterium]
MKMVYRRGMLPLSGVLSAIEGFRPHWLKDAEASYIEGFDRTGLSLFFTDTLEFEEFAKRVQLPEDAVERERVFRSDFELDPRRWTKLHFRGGVRDGFSQYFVVDPRLNYPVTTLRVLGKRLGLSEPRRVEPAFQRALVEPGTLFAVIAKVGERTSPRLSTRLPRTILSEVLADFESAGYITSAVRLLIEEAQGQVIAGDWAYLSVDPETPDGISLDFEKPVTSEIPSPRYLKIRPRNGQIEKSAYFRVIDLWTPEEIVSATKAEEVRALDYYELHHPAILSALGHTYQTGTLSADPGEHNKALIERAQVQPGSMVVDAGCGSGGPACDLLDAVANTKVLGVTLSPAQAASAVELADRRGLSDRVRFVVGDYSSLPTEDGSANHVLFLESLGYSKDAGIPMKEAARVLKPGGRIYIKDVFRKSNMTPGERLEIAEFTNLYGYHPLTPAELVKAVEAAGFADVKINPFGQEMSSGPFHQAMFEKNSPNDFGKHHHRAFSQLPLGFGEVTAVKP